MKIFRIVMKIIPDTISGAHGRRKIIDTDAHYTFKTGPMADMFCYI